MEGNTIRATAATKLNDESSRSHALLCITVKTSKKDSSESKSSKLWLVDLAGSEQLAKTGAVGERLEESKKIN